MLDDVYIERCALDFWDLMYDNHLKQWTIILHDQLSQLEVEFMKNSWELFKRLFVNHHLNISKLVTVDWRCQLIFIRQVSNDFYVESYIIELSIFQLWRSILKFEIWNLKFEIWNLKFECGSLRPATRDGRPDWVFKKEETPWVRFQISKAVKLKTLAQNYRSIPSFLVLR